VSLKVCTSSLITIRGQVTHKYVKFIETWDLGAFPMQAGPNLHRLELHLLRVRFPALPSVETYISLEPSVTAKSDACYPSCFVSWIRVAGATANLQEAITNIRNALLGTQGH
jgi:hypothetical protein